jgi:hypothetical protein
VFGGRAISDPFQITPPHTQGFGPQKLQLKGTTCYFFSNTLSIPGTLTKIPSRIEDMSPIANFLEQLLLLGLQVLKSLLSS